MRPEQYVALMSAKAYPQACQEALTLNGRLVCSGIAEDIGRQLLVYGRRIPKAEMFARIDAVDASTIKAVADRFIYDQDIAICAMGDIKELPDYTYFRRRTYWLRY